jgi:hypothetical protein
MIHPMSPQPRLPIQVLLDHDVLTSRHLVDHQLGCVFKFEQSFTHSLPPISKRFTGVDHIGGNMFESVPSGDAIFMKVMIASLTAS